MQNQVGGLHLLQGGAKSGHQLGRQIADETDRVGKDDFTPARQSDLPHGRVEGGEQHVLGQYLGLGQTIEQRRLAGVGVPDQGDGRKRHPPARVTVQPTGAAHLVQFAFNTDDAIVDEAPVDFQLAFARPAKKSAAAALTLQMGP